MADPKLLRAIMRLCDHLEQINPDNPDYPDCPFDLRGRVYRGRSILNIKDARAALSILEFPRQDFTAPVGEHGIVRNDKPYFMLQGWPEDDPDNPSDPAYRLKAYCEQHLARIIAEKENGRGPVHDAEYMLGMNGDERYLTSFAMAQGVVRPPEDAASRLAMFYMPLVLGIKTDLSDPW